MMCSKQKLKLEHWERFQIFKIKGFMSDQIATTSGVSQGSHCGPVLFNL